MKPEEWVEFRGLLGKADINELKYMRKLIDNYIKWTLEEGS